MKWEIKMNLQSKNLRPGLKEQEEFYNSYWEKLGPYSSLKVARITKIMEYLSLVRKSISNPVILDLGCGDGRSVAIWNLFGIATGFDLSEKAIENARILFPGMHFESGDATHTQFSDQQFDVIISHEVIEHIEDQSAYVNECARLTKKNGYLILTTPNKYYFDHFIKGNYSKQPIENIISYKELKSLIDNDYRILDSQSVVAGNAEKGIYFVLTNKYVIAILKRLKLDFIRLHIFQRQLLGVHLCIYAQKK